MYIGHLNFLVCKGFERDGLAKRMSGGMTTIDPKRGSGDEVVSRQERHRIRNVFCITDAIKQMKSG